MSLLNYIIFKKNVGEEKIMEKCSSERKIPRLIPIVNSEGIYVDFARVEFYPGEEIVELWLWVKNQFSETIYVSFKNVCVNHKKVYADYALDEMEGGKGDYLKMTLYAEELKDVCTYSELERAEFKVEIDDAEVKPLLWSKKIEILLNMEKETFDIVQKESLNLEDEEPKSQSRKVLTDIRYQMKL